MLATLWLLQILLIVWDGQIGDIHLMSNNSNSMQKDLNNIISFRYSYHHFAFLK